MQFRLPKPLHGWRAFFGEVGIIVVGVLLALGAQQLVDDWNWRRTIEAQKKALDEDVSGMWKAMSARMIVQGCVDKRLNDIKTVFLRHDQGVSLRIIAPIGRPTVWSASQNALRMVTADGSLAHMQLEDKRAYFAVAGSYDTFARTALEERVNWRVLQRLNEPAQLSPSDWSEVRNAYQDALDANRVMKINLVFSGDGRWLTGFTKFPRYPRNEEALTLPFVQELCRPAVQL